jgi:hypothetical protein
MSGCADASIRCFLEARIATKRKGMTTLVFPNHLSRSGTLIGGDFQGVLKRAGKSNGISAVGKSLSVDDSDVSHCRADELLP